jgi:hypothetical protein
MEITTLNLSFKHDREELSALEDQSFARLAKDIGRRCLKTLVQKQETI